MAYKLIYLARRAKPVSWEDWPRTWKSHAVFASQFPAMAGTIDWMRYTVRVDDPDFARLPVSTAHDGVCVAQAHDLATLRGEGFLPDQRARIDADELRVFDRYTPGVHVLVRRATAPQRPARRGGGVPVPRAAPGDFAAKLGDAFAGMAGAADCGALRWALNRTVEPSPPDFPFEAIEECWFADVEAAARALESADAKRLCRGLSEVCDLDRSIAMLTHPTHRWPKSNFVNAEMQ